MKIKIKMTRKNKMLSKVCSKEIVPLHPSLKKLATPLPRLKDVNLALLGRLALFIVTIFQKLVIEKVLSKVLSKIKVKMKKMKKNYNFQTTFMQWLTLATKKT